MALHCEVEVNRVALDEKQSSLLDVLTDDTYFMLDMARPRHIVSRLTISSQGRQVVAGAAYVVAAVAAVTAAAQG